MAQPPQLALEELARRVGAEVRGDGARRVRGVAGLDEAGPEEVAFYANPRYREELSRTRAAAVIVAEDEAKLVPPGAAQLVAAQPYVAFAKASAIFHPEERPPSGVHPSAQVGAGAEVDPSASVAAGCIVGRGARIGARTVLHAGASVLDEARVGADCILWTGAVVRDRCVLGDRVVLQMGTDTHALDPLAHLCTARSRKRASRASRMTWSWAPAPAWIAPRWARR